MSSNDFDNSLLGLSSHEMTETFLDRDISQDAVIFDRDSFDEEPRMLSEVEEQIENRAKELLKKPLLQSAKEIAARAIAAEELKSKHINKKLNLQGIAALLKVIGDLDGGDVALTLPEDMDEAIKHLVKCRAKGELKSIQGNDLANLLGKQKDAIELRNIKEKLDELEALDKANQVRKEVKISYRNETETETETETEISDV